MGSDQLLPVLAVVLSMLAIVGAVVVGLLLRSYRHNQRVIMGSRGTVDIAEHMAIVDDKLTNLRLAVEDLTLTARDHGVRIDGTLSHVGIVRFDAYHDLGGRQSTAVALLTAHADGVVITTVVSREFARMYVKLVKNGVGDIPLAPEENEAVEQARKASPFVLKPQTDEIEGEETSSEEATAFDETAATMAVGLPGPFEDQEKDARSLERENRRRKRKGLPLVKPEDIESSVQGWGVPETPVPPGLSMAEQFVQQRKQGRRAPAEIDEDDTATVALSEDERWPAEPGYDEGWASDTGRDEGSAPEPDDDEQWASVPEDDGWGFPVPDDDTREV